MTSSNYKDEFENYLKEFQVTEEIRLNRLDICNTCDRKVVKLGIDTCGECNCIIALATRMKKKQCPIGKW